MTVVVTHLSASAACVVWSIIEKIKVGKPSALGIATGSIAGLAAITPASGKVGPIGAICIGSISALVCWFFCAKVKQKLKYDDSLDVFGVHGVGGFIGTILVAIFASPTFGGLGYADGMTMASQLTTQLLASLYTIVLSGVVSVVLLKIIGATIGLRVDTEQENQGLDLAEHGESGYNA
jgi:Amt family ammonium transporter